MLGNRLAGVKRSAQIRNHALHITVTILPGGRDEQADPGNAGGPGTADECCSVNIHAANRQHRRPVASRQTASRGQLVKGRQTASRTL